MEKLPKYLYKDISNCEKGNKQEDIARKQINSGRVWFSKGDISTDDFVIDVKKTDKKQYILREKDITKLYEDTNPIGVRNKTPMFMIYIGDYVVSAIIQKVDELA